MSGKTCIMASSKQAIMLDFLHRKIDQLPFTKDFKMKADGMGFYSVREIVFTPKNELEKMDGYCLRWQEELEYRLAEQGMLKILDGPEAFLK
jgi:hypothetical protein